MKQVRSNGKDYDKCIKIRHTEEAEGVTGKEITETKAGNMEQKIAEQLYRTVESENSIYEYDLKCTNERMKKV